MSFVVTMFGQTPVIKDVCKSFSVTFGYVLFIAAGVFLQFYKKMVLRDAPPIAFASMIRTLMALELFVFMSFKSLTKTGLSPLFEHDHKISNSLLVFYVVVLSILGAIALGADTLSFVYLDVATKQIIDSALPAVVMLMEFFIGTACMSRCRPSAYSTVNTVVDEMGRFVFRKSGWKYVKKILVFLVGLMVVCSAWVVWQSPSVSVLGVTINASSLIASSVIIVMVETILKWDVFSQFGLIVSRLIPEVVILALISFFVKEKRPTSTHIINAVFVSFAEMGMMFLSFYLLKHSGGVSISVSNVAIFLIIVITDMLSQDSSTSRIVAVSVTSFVVALYGFLSYLWRERKAELPQSHGEHLFEGDGINRPIDPVMSLGFHRSGLDRPTSIYAVPVFNLDSNEYSSSLSEDPDKPFKDWAVVDTLSMTTSSDDTSCTVSMESGFDDA